MNQEDRYEGKPFLRLLECYVLRAIDKLAANDAQLLEDLAPKLREAYQAEGSWHDVVASVLELPDSYASEISELWQKNSELAQANQEELTPQQFAELFVDHNFPE